jgi:putative glutathione S-transferase
VISISVVNWFMGEQGWTFEDGPGVIPDPIAGAYRLHEVYTRANPMYTGRVTVPVLCDKQRNAIVSNESSEIIRMMNSAFDGVGAAAGDFYPVELRGMIDGRPDLQPRSGPMRKQCARYSVPLMRWKSGWQHIDIFAVSV